MAYDAAQTARNAEADQVNDPGYCLQQCRIWAGINAMYADASTAWRNTNDRHPGDRTIPRGAMAYWTGGSQGYGHIACSLGGPPGNPNIRSTDAGGSGRVATRSLSWFDSNWPSLNYAGWAWDINEVTIPHDDPTPPKPPEEDMPKYVLVKATTERSIPADAEWVNIVWEANPSGNDDIYKKGEAYLLLEGKMFTGALSLTAKVDQSIDVIRTRFVERQQNDKGQWVDNETYPALESKVTGGSTYVVDTRVQKCNSKRLVAQVHLGSKGGTLQGAQLNLLYF
jgi:hypothetical protein